MTLREWLNDPNRKPGFKPVPYVNLDGSLITWHWKNVMEYSENIMHDGKIVGAVHRCQKTNEVVGIDIYVEAIRGFGDLLEAMT